MCLARLPIRLNVFSQLSQLKGLSPVCTLKRKKLRLVMFQLSGDIDHLICWTRVPFRANVFPQVSHVKGFSPVCTLKRKKMKMSVKSEIFEPLSVS